MHQLTDDPAHGSHRLLTHIGEVGQAELIGKQHRVHPALLKGQEILPCLIHHPVHALLLVIARVSRHCLHVAHGDDRLFRSDHFF